MVNLIKTNKDFYFKNFLVIKNQASRLVNLNLNVVQRRVYDKIEQLRAKKLPVRIAVLKARRQGISTYTAGDIFHDTTTNTNVNSLITAHDPDSTREIFDIYKTYYENLPPEMRPMSKYNNRTELIFENPSEKNRDTTPGLNSSIKVATANKLQLGRGWNVKNYHGSEVGFYNNAKKLMLSVFQAVPFLPETTIILESTANGVGTWWQKFYMRAYRGENNYTAMFFPWFEFPDYIKPFPDTKRKNYFETTLDEEELVLKDKFKVSLEQLNWRRWCIDNNCDGDINQFHQEYPATVEEAFISSGRPAFDSNKLLRIEVKNGIKVDIVKKNNVYSFIRNTQGEFTLYEAPAKDHNYIMGGDVAEGKLVESEELDGEVKNKGDYSVLYVVDVVTRNLVAKWRGHIDPDLLAEKALLLGYLFNTALIAIERNWYGLVTNKALLKLNYPKQRIYFSVVVDQSTNKRTKKIGWITDKKTRPLIVNAVRAYIRDGEGKLRDQDLVSECLTFVVKDNHKEEAEEGCHDDCVITFGIALVAIYRMASSLTIIPGAKNKPLNEREYWESVLIPNFINKP